MNEISKKTNYAYLAFALVVLVIAGLWFRNSAQQTNDDLDRRLQGPQPTDSN